METINRSTFIRFAHATSESTIMGYRGYCCIAIFSFINGSERFPSEDSVKHGLLGKHTSIIRTRGQSRPKTRKNTTCLEQLVGNDALLFLTISNTPHGGNSHVTHSRTTYSLGTGFL